MNEINQSSFVWFHLLVTLNNAYQWKTEPFRHGFITFDDLLCNNLIKLLDYTPSPPMAFILTEHCAENTRESHAVDRNFHLMKGSENLKNSEGLGLFLSSLSLSFFSIGFYNY